MFVDCVVLLYLNLDGRSFISLRWAINPYSSFPQYPLSSVFIFRRIFVISMCFMVS